MSSRSSHSFLSQATLIAGITLVSRLLGLARESVAAAFFGAGAVWSAFTVAFTIPNLFRKLLGEGALSAAFIPLYAQAVREQEVSAREFAVASVNLLVLILVGLTVAGELVLGLLWLVVERADYQLAVQLTAIMLPYVMLVCGTAFLGAILQVHGRFAAVAATAIVLNLFLIAGIVLGRGWFDLGTEAGRVAAVRWLAVAVLLAGVGQVAMLLPSLRAVGFRLKFRAALWTPSVRRMLSMTVPVALGAGVLQIGVLLDKGISFLLASAGGATDFSLLGWRIPYPMVEGAAARLNWAQFMYQFPLGVFAIALATAIFPRLSADAMDADRERFRGVLRRGLEAALFIGLPASVGMIVVRYPAVRLLFERGQFTWEDSRWVALSTAIYSGAIWAFSLQQILNRACYALHDTATPLRWTSINLALNLVVELPLLWTPLGESAMAVGTLVSFTVQSLAMLWLLSRRVGGLGLRSEGSLVRIGVMVVSSLVMWGVCVGAQWLPFWPRGEGKTTWLVQLVLLMGLGGTVYFALCAALGINVLERLGRERGGREL